ncbi:MAG: CPBP family intramembrane metalloprotease [Clostridia bacterium]|nr:CPBP family intramembrane metalloprotease [Clostridia bacterium]
MKGKNSKKAVAVALLVLIQLVISSAAPILSAHLDSYLKVTAVKLIYALSFVLPYIFWKRVIKPVGKSYKKHVWCEYKLPAFFIAFAAIVAFLQLNIVILELVGVTGTSSSGGMFEGFFGFLFSVLMYVLIPAVSEELFSRGVLMRVAGFGMHAAFLSGIFFGLCHFNPYQLIYSVGAGIVLSLLYLYTDDIKMPIYLHLTVNMTVLCLSYLSRICSVGTYVAIECIVWLAVLAIGIYYSYVLLRDHHRDIYEKNKDIREHKGDVTYREIFSPAMIVVYTVIVAATLLRLL